MPYPLYIKIIIQKIIIYSDWVDIHLFQIKLSSINTCREHDLTSGEKKIALDKHHIFF